MVTLVFLSKIIFVRKTEALLGSETRVRCTILIAGLNLLLK